jgi:hypothetical protein
MCSPANTYHHIENASESRKRLFGRHGIGLTRLVDHLAHVTDAFGALGLALMSGEDVARARRPGLNGLADVTLAKTVAVADVQEANPTRRCDWFALTGGAPRLQVVLSDAVDAPAAAGEERA